MILRRHLDTHSLQTIRVNPDNKARRMNAVSVTRHNFRVVSPIKQARALASTEAQHAYPSVLENRGITDEISQSRCSDYRARARRGKMRRKRYDIRVPRWERRGMTYAPRDHAVREIRETLDDGRDLRRTGRETREP